MDDSGSDHIREIRRRFSQIRLKRGFFLVLFLIVLTVIIIKTAMGESGSWQDIVLLFAVYLIPFLLISRAVRGAGQPFRCILKEGTGDTAQIFTVIPLLAISVGFVWTIIVTLNLISPGAAERYLSWLNNSEVFEYGPETGVLTYILFLFVITIVAPVVEEVIFRGVMMERLGAKYSYGRAVIISSALFGILHPEPVSAFIVGVVLSLVYLDTRSLKIPILIHIANNTIAASFMVADRMYGFSHGGWETAAPYIQYGWIGVTLFTAGIAWFAWYLNQNVGRAMERKPFKLDTESQLPESE